MSPCFYEGKIVLPLRIFRSLLDSEYPGDGFDRWKSAPALWHRHSGA
jgi:hypothetical protein